MTATSQGEFRLPRAVVERSARIAATLEARKTSAAAAPPPPSGDAPPPANTETDPPNGGKPPATDPRENDAAYWRQRFNVTQGMLRTSQEHLREANTEKDRELTELKERIRTLEAGTNSGSEAVDLATFFTPEQIERFGQDQCEAMATTALKAAKQSAQQLIETEMKPLKDQAKARTESAAAAKEAEFWEKLAELRPDFEEINADPKWLEWLPEPDPATGLIRQEILDRHRRAHNAAGVAKVFDTFLKGRTRPAPPVAPPRSAAADGNDGARQNAPTAGYPSRDEIRAFYKDLKLNKVKEPDRLAFEARLRSKPGSA